MIQPRFRDRVMQIWQARQRTPATQTECRRCRIQDGRWIHAHGILKHHTALGEVSWQAKLVPMVWQERVDAAGIISGGLIARDCSRVFSIQQLSLLKQDLTQLLIFHILHRNRVINGEGGRGTGALTEDHEDRLHSRRAKGDVRG